MFNLIKYNFLRKGFLVAIVLVCTILANLFVGFRYGEFQIVGFLSIVWAILSVLFLVDIILMYSRDLNSNEGYNLFMTPNSGYKILGSKVITAIIEGFIIVLFYSGLFLINMKIFFGDEINFTNLDLPLGFSVAHFTVMLAFVLIMIIQFILTIFTSMTIRKSLLSNVKFGGLISFVCFIAVNFAIGKFYQLVSMVFDATSDVNIFSMEFDGVGFSGSIAPVSTFVTELLPLTAITVFVIAVLSFASGYLLENRINL